MLFNGEIEVVRYSEGDGVCRPSTIVPLAAAFSVR